MTNSVKEAQPIRLQHFHNSTVLLKEIAVTDIKQISEQYFFLFSTCLPRAYESSL